MGSLGMAGYLATVSVMFKKSPQNVFWMVAVFDTLALIYLLIMICCGKFGSKPKINDGGSDGGSGQSDKRGADEGLGGYNDIPDLHEVYHEQILEADEGMEGSLKGSIL